MNVSSPVDHVDSPALAELEAQLEALAPTLDEPRAWPAEQLEICARAGVFRWFLDRSAGGLQWSGEDQIRGYLRLARACLTTTFVITQRVGAIRRLAASSNRGLRERWLPQLLHGGRSATVGISHLTTSRRHLARPVLRAQPTASGYVLDGYSPWVTGADYCDAVLVGAVVEDSSSGTEFFEGPRQVLVWVPTDQPEMQAGPGIDLLALSASRTDRVDFDRVEVGEDQVISGPARDVLGRGGGASTGGLQTTTLALGLSAAAIAFLQREAVARESLDPIHEALREEQAELEAQLLQLAASSASQDASPPPCDPAQLRGVANRLVLRSTQAALSAAKGAGFVRGHPAGRWAREALFFLVWSCPQPVTEAHLCELAGIG